MKKVLPLFMAAVIAAAGIPATAGATDVVQSEEQGTSGDETVQNTEESAQVPDVAEQAQDAADTQETGDAVQAEGAGETPETAGETGSQEESSDDTAEEDGSENSTDSEKVVTLGENLNEEQRAAMYEYFGTSADQVKTIVVTHADEVKYMEGIATAEQIGPTTNSCAYVEPTESGGIKVKTANLNYVTSAMIASTLTTAGMENCNVIAACPFEVSGTGALTGIIMAYETASGEDLDEGKKEAAMEELVTTGELADSVGQEKATEVMKDVKTEVLDKGLTEPEEIQDAVSDIAEKNDISLTPEQQEQIVALMEKISQYDYDVNALKNTLNNLTGEDGLLANVWNSVKTFFVGSDDGILNETNEDALGADVITDSTENENGFKDGLFTRIKKFFTGE